VRFWDASAVVPLLVRESRTKAARTLLTEDPNMIVWWITRSECISALTRKMREGVFTPLEHAQARVRLHQLQRAWTEMQPISGVRALAEVLLQRHLLRTADAYQLAAALRWRGGAAQGAPFVCLDGKLRQAAESEGFTVTPTL
jgi:predicted nucleic acid-binding protein